MIEKLDITDFCIITIRIQVFKTLFYSISSSAVYDIGYPV